MSTTYFDKDLLSLLNKLNHHPSILKFKQFLMDQEYDYDLIADDMQCSEDESDILESFGKELYLEIKSLTCFDNILYDDSDIGSDAKNEETYIDHDIKHKSNHDPRYLQNLILILETLPNKNATHILLDFLRRENFDSIEAIYEDIEEEFNSVIFDFLEYRKIDRSFYTAFCDKIHELDHQRYIEKAIRTNDEWSVILQRMMQNHSFTDAIYSKTIRHFRDNQYTVESYCDDELNSDYALSEFHHIFPQMRDEHKRLLISIFEGAITPFYDECKEEEQRGNNVHKSAQNVTFTSQYYIEQMEDISDGNVCDCTHSRYQQMEYILDHCAQMVHMRSTAQISGDSDLKALCSILSPNHVLEISDIFCRQYLVALYNKDEDEMNDYLTDITSNNTIITLLEEFIHDQYLLKPHDTNKFSLYVSHTFNVLSIQRWLGYLTPPISKVSEYETSDAESMGINTLKGNALNVQIYVFAFLISSTGILIKNFEHTNVSFMLDMKFVDAIYDEDECALDAWRLKKQSKMDLQNKILQFLEPFQNPQIRESVIDKVRNEHCLLVHTVNFNEDKGSKDRWNNMKPKLCALNKKYIGFDISDKEYMQRLNACELFQICRAKKYFLDQIYHENKHRYIGNVDRMAISLHKFGNRVKFYLYFGESVYRLRCEDICEWIPLMFDKKDTALKWKQAKDILRSSLRDNEKLANPMNAIEIYMNQQMDFVPNDDIDRNVYKENHKKANFWRNIQKWSDLDKDFYRKCDMFTYKMKKKYSLKYGHGMFDKNIVDKDTLINLR